MMTKKDKLNEIVENFKLDVNEIYDLSAVIPYIYSSPIEEIVIMITLCFRDSNNLPSIESLIKYHNIQIPQDKYIELLRIFNDFVHLFKTVLNS